jgi:oligosaccharide reducing-end xylanase
MRGALPSVFLIAAGVICAACGTGTSQITAGGAGGAGGAGTGTGGGGAGAGGGAAGAGGGAAGAGGGAAAGGSGGATDGGTAGAGGGGAGAGGAAGSIDPGTGGNCQAPAPGGNLFASVLGKSQADTTTKVNAAFQALFHGGANNTVYYEVGTDQAYVLDVADNDVRTEGMSYGMMIAVQLDKQQEFNRIWSWAQQYMYQSSGSMAGYFAWHRSSTGAALSTTTYPAPDGEEYFATALIFASKRWGDGTGIFDYAGQARALLDVMVHRGEAADAQAAGITSMFDPTANLVVFVPNATSGSSTFTDPSYVMPAFYDVWRCFDAKNAPFWRAVSAASRAFLPKATNPTTGLAPEYAAFDGTPSTVMNKGDFRFDAWRVVMNVMADQRFWGLDPWQKTYATRLGAFFTGQGASYGDQYSLSGTALGTDHSAGLVAVNATLGFGLPAASAKPFVQALWDLAIPSGQYRYYNGLLYMLALLHASGTFQLWF